MIWSYNLAFYQKIKEGYLLRVRLTPNSSCCKISGIINDAKGDEYLKVCVVSVPEKGKANKELLDFLAKILDISKSSLVVTFGQTDRYKKIMLSTNQNLDTKLGELNECNNH